MLYPDRAPGGGTAYITDTGREVIRLNALGGATYFPEDAPDGVIVEYASPAAGLTPIPRAPGEVRSQAERLAGDLARMLNRNISVEYAPAPRAGLGVQFDTLMQVDRALAQIPGDRRRLRDLAGISLVLGESAGAFIDGDTLIIVIAPEAGYAGRPSSARIAQVLAQMAS